MSLNPSLNVLKHQCKHASLCTVNMEISPCDHNANISVWIRDNSPQMGSFENRLMHLDPYSRANCWEGERLIEAFVPVGIKRQGKSSEEECVYWEKRSGGLCCLFPSNDEARACDVFCLPGLSSSLPLASSLCVKSQAPVLDSKHQEAK